MRKLIIMTILAFGICAANAATPTAKGKVQEITSVKFSQLVSQYTNGYASWKFIGKKPAVIDFYATWCGPCRKLAPIMEELAQEYSGKVDFYKIDIDNNKDIAQAYSISSIPLLLLAPTTGKPEQIGGLYPKEEIKKAIEHMFFPKKIKRNNIKL